MNEQAERFFEKAKQWKEEFHVLRKIVRENKSLEEDYKWMHPCYTFQGQNIVLIHGFKEYCALLFHKGALLKDPKKILVQQTKNVQSARQIRFSNMDEILKNRSIVKAYIKEAIQNEKAGLKVEMKTTTEFEMPQEFQSALTEMPDLKTAFYRLTPGRQRGYLLYFSSAKQAKTRMDRIEKYIPKILENKGLND
ncbi:YdeI/OmpD-associated family protein [Olivibacter sitiensis]|uniref:YdeI/OmpD-associated family protein n=1 Tax=Olivibacter sitiensis TaxID=376470 RepID=UPI000411D35D|nr:DUF1801 domain-containing protein [Olivibacter sitiensis]